MSISNWSTCIAYVIYDRLKFDRKLCDRANPGRHFVAPLLNTFDA